MTNLWRGKLRRWMPLTPDEASSAEGYIAGLEGHLEAKDALIRELVSLLYVATSVGRGWSGADQEAAQAALTKAKEQGYV